MQRKCEGVEWGRQTEEKDKTKRKEVQIDVAQKGTHA